MILILEGASDRSSLGCQFEIALETSMGNFDKYENFYD